MCRYCYIRPADVVFKPCLDLLYCDQCWGVKISLDKCPLCDVNIDSAKMFESRHAPSWQQAQQYQQQERARKVQPPTQSNKTKIESMSGQWSGFSKPADVSKQPTEWANTEIYFNEKPGDPNILMISGKGSSLFQGEEIHFHLTGTVDSHTLAFELFKTHTGRFQHTLVYRGLLDLNTHTLSGSFAGGSVTLKQVQWGPSYGFRNRSKDPLYGSMPAAQQNAVLTPSDIYIALDFDLTLTDSHSGGFAMKHYKEGKFDMSVPEKDMFRSKITEWAGKGYHIIILTRNVDTEIEDYLNTFFSGIQQYFTILAPDAEKYASSYDAMEWAKWKRDTLQRHLKNMPKAKTVFVDDTKVNVDVMQSLPNVVSYHKPAGISYTETYRKVKDFLDDPDGELRKKLAARGGRSKKYRRTRHKKRGTKRGTKRRTKRLTKRNIRRN